MTSSGAAPGRSRRGRRAATALAGALLACAAAQQQRLSRHDDFTVDCRSPEETNDWFTARCEGGAYRWTVTRSPVHVREDLGLSAGTVTFEVGASVAGGPSAVPGNTAYGIGCLTALGSPLSPGRMRRGYLAMVRTDGGWGIVRMDFDTLQGRDRWVPLAGSNQPGAIPELLPSNRLAITCSRAAASTVVRLDVNGREVKTVVDGGFDHLGPPDAFYGTYLWALMVPGEIAFEHLSARFPDPLGPVVPAAREARPEMLYVPGPSTGAQKAP